MAKKSHSSFSIFLFFSFFLYAWQCRLYSRSHPTLLPLSLLVHWVVIDGSASSIRHVVHLRSNEPIASPPQTSSTISIHHQHHHYQSDPKINLPPALLDGKRKEEGIKGELAHTQKPRSSSVDMMRNRISTLLMSYNGYIGMLLMKSALLSFSSSRHSSSRIRLFSCGS